MEAGFPTISAAEWNRVGDHARRNVPLSGLGVRLLWTRGGVIVSAHGGNEFRHPWQLSCRWRETEPGKGQWVATVRPGFVNGRDATIQENREGKAVDVPLTDEQPPELILASFRNPAQASGVSADLAGNFSQTAGEGYPAFFESLGVTPAAKTGPIGAEAEDATGRTAQIRACDVVLITPRIATRQTVTVTNPLAEGRTVEIGTEFLNTELRNAPANRLISTGKHTGPPEPTVLDRLAGTAVEPQTDELKLATVYLVSPPGAEEDAEPDETWTAYPAHFVFWNLAHASLAQFPEVPAKPLQVFLPLAGGVGQPIANELLSLSNDATAAIMAFLGGANFRGIFWAPSGLGVETLNRPKPRSSQDDESGLDPGRRRATRNARESEQLADVPPLNPPFPFRKTPFDPFAFGLQEEPKAAPASV